MLSPATGYALIAIAALDRAENRSLAIHELADRADVPRAYLAKIMAELSRLGFVRSRRGKNGGVALLRPAREITLYEVCDALNDPALEHRCLIGLELCKSGQHCPAKATCRDQHAELMRFLHDTAVADLDTFAAARTTTPETHEGEHARSRTIRA